MISGLKLLKMFWIVLFCLCFCHLHGVFGDEMKLVKLGDSVTLNSGLTELMDDDQILWRFGFKNILIAEMNVTDDNMTLYDDVLDGRFRDRLTLDDQTGSLTITDITMKHTGVYHGIVINRMSVSFLLAVNDEISVKKGDSVTLNSGLTEIMHDDQIQWTYMIGNASTTVIIKRADSISVYDDVLDERFRNRLKLNNQTGSLTITNITTEHAGHYVLQIFGPKESLKAFNVSVYNSVHCCGSTEAVIRLVLSALVGVATVILLVYDIRSRRAQQDHASGT
ncbi:uncharacterized protein LOC132159491 [Carassius carassius]|uniref:uncharacterized protein LOC132159491 n=1 Tax=Carassius carassius TaxID=217509 RepID=UPI0028693867|nr:uncharacterized protein LOC132159491 [Carassius carassius]